MTLNASLGGEREVGVVGARARGRRTGSARPRASGACERAAAVGDVAAPAAQGGAMRLSVAIAWLPGRSAATAVMAGGLRGVVLAYARVLAEPPAAPWRARRHRR